MTISERIFELMKEKNLTQKEFSKRAHIPESTISDWKKKGNTPSAEKLMDIANALQVSLSELLGEAVIESSREDYALNGEEKTLLEMYRALPEKQKKRCLLYFQNLSEVNGQQSSKTALEKKNETVIADTEFLLQKQLAYKLRRLARLDRIKLDESKHASGRNLHLFKYLDYLGIDKLEYLRTYLANIQPFMITEMKTQEKFENAICVLDQFYRISVYIKVDATKEEEIIVSFHENEKNGVAKKNPIFPKNNYVYVFAESLGSYVIPTDSYTINLLITRGVSTFPINVPAKKYDEDGFLVNYTYINNALTDIANQYLEDLYSTDLDFSAIEVFSSLQQLSFTSYGHDCFSNISLLIDSLLILTDANAKMISDGALCIYCNSLDLLESDKKELIATLTTRFEVNSSRALPEILERVKMNIV